VNLHDFNLSVLPSTASDLMTELLAFTPAQSCEDVLSFFVKNPDCETIPVVDQEHPVGLITRQVFMDRYARPFHRELFGPKSCAAFMDDAPLIVDRSETIAELGAKAAKLADKALKSGFIITEQGRYIGIGTGPALMRALSDTQRQGAHVVVKWYVEPDD